VTSAPAKESVRRRRSELLVLLSVAPLTVVELLARLTPPLSARTLADDLAWLRRTFPGRVEIVKQNRANTWRFISEPPILLGSPLTHLDEDQIAALIAARGLLRLPDPTSPAAEDPGDAYHGTLSQAIDRLLRDAGLADEAKLIAPDAIAISRFGVAPEEDAAFPACLSAIRAGESLAFTYTNLDGATHAVHARPVRLVHIAGEWHCVSWAPDEREKPGKLKQYRLSRMTGVTRRSSAPAGCPLMGLRAEAAALLRDAFRATGSTKPKQRVAVVLAISPKAWPFIENRRWGADQRDLPADGLPAGWRRLRFVTTGLLECQHWVLSFGAAVRAEAPNELQHWLREQAQAVLAGLPSDGSVRSVQPELQTTPLSGTTP